MGTLPEDKQRMPVNFRRLFLKGSHFCYRALIEPRSPNEDDRQKEFILNVILLGTSVLIFWSWMLIILSYAGALENDVHAPYVSLLEFTPLLLAVLGIYRLSRKGYAKLASHLLVGLLFAGMAYTTVMWGASLGIGLLFYAVLIIISSATIGTRFGFFMTMLSISMLVRFGYAEIQAATLPLWKMRGIRTADITEFCLALLLIQTLSWLSNREIRKNLDRARNSEAALKEERDLLEIKVSDRTAELRHAQAEKMAQVYRFVEFGKLSSGLFHDLMGSLSLVSLQVERLREEFHPSLPEIKESLEKTVEASKRMEKFIRVVRKQVRVDSFSEIFVVNEEIEEALTLFAYKANRAGITLRFEADETVSTYGNPIKFHHMITNLISNAVDSYEGMKVSGRRKAISVRLSSEEGMISVSVRDGGSGISSGLREKIFEPLFTTKPEERGMGLGLSNTRRVVEKDFGGTIAFESAKGGGSVFTLAFPVRIS